MQFSNLLNKVQINSKSAMAVLLSSVLISSTLMPVSSASAHDLRHGKRFEKHHHGKIARHKRKKHHKKHSSKRSSKGDKLVAGILGFAIGALIVGEAAKAKQHRYTQQQPVYVDPNYNNTYHNPQYNGQVYRQPIDLGNPYYNEPTNLAPQYVERRSLNTVRQDPIYTSPQTKIDDGPKVIRYEDEVAKASYEPWSQEWFSYCKSKFRSFNPTTGTYLGYDGLNHFCVVR
ncbi:MAG: BA14K family protein [Nitratireductor sp.]